jgi:molybdopterin-containing oxidoreductase family iron-sulfur binding subunit
MEKCSYCLQRITRARLEAEKQNRELRDGEVVTACQGACPTRAITFGDTSDTASAVSREKKSSRHYTLLEELNTRPRTTYLARIINRTADANSTSPDQL